MAVQCPYCGFGMELKGARPGRFGPKCRQCGEKFVLIISADPNVPPVVQQAKKDTVSPAVAVALGIESPARQRQPTQTMPPPVATIAPPLVEQLSPRREQNNDSFVAAIRDAQRMMDDIDDPPRAPSPPPASPSMMQTAVPTQPPAKQTSIPATVKKNNDELRDPEQSG